MATQALPTYSQFMRSLQTTTATGDCTICTDPLAAAVAVTLHDAHTFCRDCARRWLADNDSCPLCRARLYRPEEPRPLPGHDHGYFLQGLHNFIQRERHHHGSFWYVARGDAIITSMIEQGRRWTTGHVGNVGVAAAPHAAARPRLAALSVAPRVVDAEHVRTALLARFMLQVVDALSAGRWSGPEVHPLTWQAFGLMLEWVDSTGNWMGGATAEQVEDSLEEWVWKRLRVPNRIDGRSRSDWFCISTLEERRDLPTGIRALVLDLVEEVYMAHEDGKPARGESVPRRDSSL